MVKIMSNEKTSDVKIYYELGDPVLLKDAVYKVYKFYKLFERIEEKDIELFADSLLRQLYADIDAVIEVYPLIENKPEFKEAVELMDKIFEIDNTYFSQYDDVETMKVNDVYSNELEDKEVVLINPLLSDGTNIKEVEEKEIEKLNLVNLLEDVDLFKSVLSEDIEKLNNLLNESPSEEQEFYINRTKNILTILKEQYKNDAYENIMIEDDVIFDNNSSDVTDMLQMLMEYWASDKSSNNIEVNLLLEEVDGVIKSNVLENENENEIEEEDISEFETLVPPLINDVDEDFSKFETLIPPLVDVNDVFDVEDEKENLSEPFFNEEEKVDNVVKEVEVEKEELSSFNPFEYLYENETESDTEIKESPSPPPIPIYKNESKILDYYNSNDLDSLENHLEDIHSKFKEENRLIKRNIDLALSSVDSEFDNILHIIQKTELTDEEYFISKKYNELQKEKLDNINEIKKFEENCKGLDFFDEIKASLTIYPNVKDEKIKGLIKDFVGDLDVIKFINSDSDNLKPKIFENNEFDLFKSFLIENYSKENLIENINDKIQRFTHNLPPHVFSSDDYYISLINLKSDIINYEDKPKVFEIDRSKIKPLKNEIIKVKSNKIKPKEKSQKYLKSKEFFINTILKCKKFLVEKYLKSKEHLGKAYNTSKVFLCDKSKKGKESLSKSFKKSKVHLMEAYLNRKEKLKEKKEKPKVKKVKEIKVKTPKVKKVPQYVEVLDFIKSNEHNHEHFLNFENFEKMNILKKYLDLKEVCTTCLHDEKEYDLEGIEKVIMKITENNLKGKKTKFKGFVKELEKEKVPYISYLKLISNKSKIDDLLFNLNISCIPQSKIYERENSWKDKFKLFVVASSIVAAGSAGYLGYSNNLHEDVSKSSVKYYEEKKDAIKKMEKDVIGSLSNNKLKLKEIKKKFKN